MDKAAKRLAVIYVVLFVVYFILTFGVLVGTRGLALLLRLYGFRL